MDIESGAYAASDYAVLSKYFHRHGMDGLGDWVGCRAGFISTYVDTVMALPLALFKLFVAFFLAAHIDEVDQANNEPRNH